MRKETLAFAVLVGTRGCFSSELARAGRERLLQQITRLGHRAVILPADATPHGAVETLADGHKYAAWFNQHRAEIDGVIISLPNFGDELGIINALTASRLGVPILVQASDDDLDRLGTHQRRDAFCGKLSVCNNLWQHGLPFTDTTTHTLPVDSPEFGRDLARFATVCRVVGGLRRARIGAIGARPGAFQTMRASEKLLQRAGVTTVPVDLSEIIAAAGRVDVQSARAKEKLAELRGYGTVAAGVANLEAKFEKHLRLYVALEDWMQANAIDAAGIQCWTSIQQNFGCATCLSMAMMGDRLLPCACEVDLAGVTAMYALVLATGSAAAIVDWNNNYGTERDKCVAQHCGNYPRSFVGRPVEVDTLSVLGTVLDPEACFGALNAKVAPGPFTFLRFSTDDFNGRIRGYVGEGRFTDDPFPMLGSIGVCEVPRLQSLLKFICQRGFEHHVAMVRSQVADVIHEATTTYLGWDMYRHE